MNALEVKEHIEKLLALDSKILNLIYGNLNISKKTLENSKRGNLNKFMKFRLSIIKQWS